MTPASSAGAAAGGQIDAADRTIVLTRTVSAPRDLVWRAWTEPARIGRWWGPNGFTTTTQAMDVRPGGVWRYVMHGPDGVDYQNLIHYQEVVAPSLLRYAHGETEGEPAHFEVTVTFEERGGQTVVTMRSVFPSAEARRQVEEYGATEGGKQTLTRLEAHVAAAVAALDDRSLLLTRVLDAPREAVWRAWTEVDRLAQWWGPKGAAWVSATLDLRPGGLLHYAMRTPDGREQWGKLVYYEVAAPEQLVFTNSFSDAAGATVRAPFSADWPLEIMNVLTLSEEGGRTTLTLRGGPFRASERELQAYAAARPMLQQGMAGTFEQLDAFLAQG